MDSVVDVVLHVVFVIGTLGDSDSRRKIAVNKIHGSNDNWQRDRVESWKQFAASSSLRPAKME